MTTCAKYEPTNCLYPNPSPTRDCHGRAQCFKARGLAMTGIVGDFSFLYPDYSSIQVVVWQASMSSLLRNAIAAVGHAATHSSADLVSASSKL